MTENRLEDRSSQTSYRKQEILGSAVTNYRSSIVTGWDGGDKFTGGRRLERFVLPKSYELMLV